MRILIGLLAHGHADGLTWKFAWRNGNVEVGEDEIFSDIQVVAQWNVVHCVGVEVQHARRKRGNRVWRKGLAVHREDGCNIAYADQAVSVCVGVERLSRKGLHYKRGEHEGEHKGEKQGEDARHEQVSLD